MCSQNFLLMQSREIFLIKDGAGYLTERTGLDDLRYKKGGDLRSQTRRILMQVSAVRYALEMIKKERM